MTQRPKDKQLQAMIEDKIGPLDGFYHQCHAASHAIVNSGIFPVSRVARGTCHGVGGQHSWVVLSMDPYDSKARIVDPTLWSYVDAVDGLWTGNGRSKYRHTPHGTGSIWEYGKPEHCGGETITLNVTTPLSDAAQDFLDMVGPLDARGWMVLASAPVGGWPCREIITAMYQTPGIQGLIPIDIVGMITDLNPGNLYLAGATS
jgi:hypothetical protein